MNSPDSIDWLLERAFVGLTAWAHLSQIRPLATSGNFRDPLFCWGDKGYRIILDSALGTNFAQGSGNKVSELYLSHRAGKRIALPDPMIENLPQAQEARVRSHLGRIINSLERKTSNKYSWLMDMLGKDPRQVLTDPELTVKLNQLTETAEFRTIDQIRDYFWDGRNRSCSSHDFIDALVRLGLNEVELDCAMNALSLQDSVSLQVATDLTLSDLVLCFTEPQNGRTLYCKLDRNIPRLESEFEFLQLAWQEPLLRPITPKPYAFRKTQDMAALLTHATFTPNLVPAQDLLEYFNLRENIFKSFAREENIPLPILQVNAALIDIYDTALMHALMRKHHKNARLGASPRPTFFTFDELHERASTTQSPLTADFYSLRALYNRLCRQSLDSMAEFAGPEGELLVDVDARRENLFPSYRTGIHPRGDRGCVQKAHPIHELAKKEMADPNLIVRLYAHATNQIEQYQGATRRINEQDMQAMAQALPLLQTISLIRQASFKLAHGSYEQAHHLLTLVQARAA